MHLTDIRIEGLVITGADTPIQGITADSRAVRENYIFAALKGRKTDGRNFIADAIQHGAVAILCAEDTKIEGAAKLAHPNPAWALSQLAAQFYGAQPRHIAAVTGTNGKTSSVHFMRQFWDGIGVQAASLGTLGLSAPGMARSGSMTTPDAVALHASLADLEAAGIDHLAMEASSHGLDQYRLDGVRVTAAGFTNLTQDHLDYHGDMARYGASKARLFSDILASDGTAILNADDNFAPVLQQICADRKIRTQSYGLQGADYKILDLHPDPAGQKIRLQIDHSIHALTLPLVGRFQAYNALCALALVAAEDSSRLPQLLKIFEMLQGAPGRLQFVPGAKRGAAYVDYAHTPDALDHVLRALRPHTQGRLICVMGCGGDRDAAKRPLMGAIAHDLADIVIVTDDNPRNEDPALIRRAVLGGAPDALEIGDRRAAIMQAVGMLAQGDVLLVAGKGHETGQTIGADILAFNDVDEVKRAFEK